MSIYQKPVKFFSFTDNTEMSSGEYSRVFSEEYKSSVFGGHFRRTKLPPIIEECGEIVLEDAPKKPSAPLALVPPGAHVKKLDPKLDPKDIQLLERMLKEPPQKREDPAKRRWKRKTDRLPLRFVKAPPLLDIHHVSESDLIIDIFTELTSAGELVF